MELLSIMTMVTAIICIILFFIACAGVIIVFVMTFEFEKFWQAALTWLGLAYVCGFLYWLGPILVEWASTLA